MEPRELKIEEAPKWESKILKKEGLSDWTIIYDRKDGFCWRKGKKIQTIKGDFALFLHEIAHAKSSVTIDKTGHDSIWGDLFTELVRKYCKRFYE